MFFLQIDASEDKHIVFERPQANKNSFYRFYFKCIHKVRRTTVIVGMKPDKLEIQL